jgi:hypothetical protein
VSIVMIPEGGTMGPDTDSGRMSPGDGLEVPGALALVWLKGLSLPPPLADELLPQRWGALRRPCAAAVRSPSLEHLPQARRITPVVGARGKGWCRLGG